MSEAETDRDTDLRQDLEALRIDRGAAPRKRRRRPLRWLVLAAAVAVAGVILARALTPRAIPVSVAAAERAAPGQVKTVPVLSGSGYIVTGDRYISVGVRVAGRIERYFVEEGQTVKADAPLVQLDDRDYRASVERAEASLAVAKANRDLAESELARGRKLRAGKVISQQELDVLENKARVGRATVSETEAQLAQARVNLDYTVLRAPGDGVVLAKLKEVGEIAVPGGFAGSGDLIRLANLDDMRAEVDVNEADLHRVHMGQPAEVAPDAYPEAHYAATVVKLYPQVDRQKGTLKVEVHIEKPDDKLLPDMSARITFLAPLPPPVDGAPLVLVPSAALRRDGDGGAFVWLVDDGHVSRTAVETAGTGLDPVPVSKGLQGGERVVVSNDDGLRDGKAVSLE